MYQLDHIVHFVAQPEQSMAQLQNEGFHVVNGGKHEAWGTYNALSYFDLSYIELIGIFDEQLFVEAAKEPHTLHESYEKTKRKNGFTRFAIRTTTIEEDAKKFSAAGYEVNGPSQFSRTREDGSVVSWQLLHIGSPNTKMDLPFFIQWDQPDSKRREEYTQRGIIAPSSLGDLAFEAIHFIVPNFKIVEQLAKLCDAKVEMTEDKKTNSEVASIILPNAQLVLSRPLGESSIWDEMLAYGYGIQKIVLSGGNVRKEIICDDAVYHLVEK